MMDTTMI
nr:unnamed protein product [Callosobruchus analis]